MNNYLGIMITVFVLTTEMECNNKKWWFGNDLSSKRKRQQEDRYLTTATMKETCDFDNDNYVFAMGRAGVQIECECKGDYIRLYNPERCVASICKTSSVNPCSPGKCVDDPTDEKMYACECPDGDSGGHKCKGHVRRAVVTVRMKNAYHWAMDKRRRHLTPHIIQLEMDIGTEVKKLDLKPKFILSREFTVLKADSEAGGLTPMDPPSAVLHLFLGHVYTTLDDQASLYVSRDKVTKAEGMLDDGNKVSYDLKSTLRRAGMHTHVITPIHMRQVKPSDNNITRKNPSHEKKETHPNPTNSSKNSMDKESQSQPADGLKQLPEKGKKQKPVADRSAGTSEHLNEEDGNIAQNPAKRVTALKKHNTLPRNRKRKSSNRSKRTKRELGKLTHQERLKSIGKKPFLKPMACGWLDEEEVDPHEPIDVTDINANAIGANLGGLPPYPDILPDPKNPSDPEVPPYPDPPPFQDEADQDFTTNNDVGDGVATPGEDAVITKKTPHPKGNLTFNYFCPHVVTVNLAVLFDDANVQILEGKVDKIITYLTTFWNKVSTLYEKDTACPKIRLSLSGIIVLSKAVSDALVGPAIEDGVDMEATVTKISEWVEKRKTEDTMMPKKSECVVFQTNRKLYKSGTTEEFPSHTIISSPCQSYAVLVDAAGDYGSYTHAAHALHTVLGAELDADKKGCASSDGYLLYAEKLTDGLQKLEFSPCSLNTMQLHVRHPDQKCFWGDPLIFFPEDLLPGSMISLTEQCIQGTDKPEASFNGVVNEAICKKLTCNDGTGDHVIEEGALDGSPCGFSKICVYKECIVFDYPSVYEMCESAGRNLRPFSTNQCQELKCIDASDKPHEEPLRPYEGTPCGYGQQVCLNGICKELLPDVSSDGGNNTLGGGSSTLDGGNSTLDDGNSTLDLISASYEPVTIAPEDAGAGGLRREMTDEVELDGWNNEVTSMVDLESQGSSSNEGDDMIPVTFEAEAQDGFNGGATNEMPDPKDLEEDTVDPEVENGAIGGSKREMPYAIDPEEDDTVDPEVENGSVDGSKREMPDAIDPEEDAPVDPEVENGSIDGSKREMLEAIDPEEDDTVDPEVENGFIDDSKREMPDAIDPEEDGTVDPNVENDSIDGSKREMPDATDPEEDDTVDPEVDNGSTDGSKREMPDAIDPEGDAGTNNGIASTVDLEYDYVDNSDSRRAMPESIVLNDEYNDGVS